ncbi:MAG: zf-HC2 domain-containing protein, partial [Candidatus Eremiobacteraeota bacterium]|nr:zf-HC2 domain-containing protein [Candidatus Eremiobacteraeota bacterium]
MNRHVDEDAELYALGALDAAEALAVERHLAACMACQERVDAALLVVASFAATLPAAEPSAHLGERLEAGRRRWKRGRDATGAGTGVRGLAVAAVLALALVGLGMQTLDTRKREAAVDVALATIAGSHFKHVTATATPAVDIVTKVLYASDGSWVFVIARGNAVGGLRAYVRSGTSETDLGSLVVTGSSASLLVRTRQRIRSIAVKRGASDGARATLDIEGRRTRALRVGVIEMERA